MMRRLALLLLAVALVASCGSDDRDSAVRFDPTRMLDPASARVLDAVSGDTARVPLDVSAHDVMSSVTTPFVGFADAATESAFTAQARAAKSAAEKYASAEAAARDGYVFASYFVPNFGVHWINWSLVDKPFDPARPAMLLYDGEGRKARLIALSYYLRNGTPPDGFAGGNDRWHRHFGTCYAGGFLIGENVETKDGCAKRCVARANNAIKAPVGTEDEIPEVEQYLSDHPNPITAPANCKLVPGNDVWMLHLWNVEGHENPNGMFSTANPNVTACVGACRDG